MSDSTKLTVYFGEADRTARGLVADALMDAFARHELRTSVLLRGAEGFGAKHGLHTERLLTLSEDLPLVAVAVDTHERIEAALPDIAPLVPAGLVTLERARFTVTADSQADVKLTLYLGRHSGEHISVIRTLHGHGVAGATAFLGVDGTAHGTRRRAKLLSSNETVPIMVIAVGTRASIAAALADLPRHTSTLENVTICKRDGRRLAGPHGDVETGWLQKLMIYSREQPDLIRRLRAEGAAGATNLRGFWGYHGDHTPHGECFLSIRRALPSVTVLIDVPQRITDLWPIVDAATAERGLVTSELVRPVLR
jgi:PII-like signaling protein